jgi:hypothetical protein
VAAEDLLLRSDADKSETSPDVDVRLRSDADKSAAGVTGDLSLTLAAAVLEALGNIHVGEAPIPAPAVFQHSEHSLVMEYGSPPMARRRRRGAGGLRADVLERQRKRLEAIFDDEELIVELLE